MSSQRAKSRSMAANTAASACSIPPSVSSENTTPKPNVSPGAFRSQRCTSWRGSSCLASAAKYSPPGPPPSTAIRTPPRYVAVHTTVNNSTCDTTAREPLPQASPPPGPPWPRPRNGVAGGAGQREVPGVPPGPAELALVGDRREVRLAAERPAGPGDDRVPAADDHARGVVLRAGHGVPGGPELSAAGGAVRHGGVIGWGVGVGDRRAGDVHRGPVRADREAGGIVVHLRGAVIGQPELVAGGRVVADRGVLVQAAGLRGGAGHVHRR